MKTLWTSLPNGSLACSLQGRSSLSAHADASAPRLTRAHRARTTLSFLLLLSLLAPHAFAQETSEEKVALPDGGRLEQTWLELPDGRRVLHGRWRERWPNHKVRAAGY